MALLQTNGFNQLRKARHGYILYNKNDKYIGRSIAHYGEFSELEIKLFKQICKKGDIVVEAGANIGTHTLALSQLVGETGKVFAFEPQRIVFQTLCANMALNSITNVYAYQTALSDRQGHVMIPDIHYDREGNFGGVEISKFTEGHPVPQIKLDDLTEIEKLDFLKIDVEGMEKEVLDGAEKLIRQYRPVMYIENDRKEKSEALMNKIKVLGYKIYAHNPLLYNADNFDKKSENLFGRIVSKNLLCIPEESGIVLKNFHAL